MFPSIHLLYYTIARFLIWNITLFGIRSREDVWVDPPKIRVALFEILGGLGLSFIFGVTFPSLSHPAAVVVNDDGGTTVTVDSTGIQKLSLMGAMFTINYIVDVLIFYCKIATYLLVEIDCSSLSSFFKQLFKVLLDKLVPISLLILWYGITVGATFSYSQGGITWTTQIILFGYGFPLFKWIMNYFSRLNTEVFIAANNTPSEKAILVSFCSASSSNIASNLAPVYMMFTNAGDYPFFILLFVPSQLVSTIGCIIYHPIAQRLLLIMTDLVRDMRMNAGGGGRRINGRVRSKQPVHPVMTEPHTVISIRRSM